MEDRTEAEVRHRRAQDGYNGHPSEGRMAGGSVRDLDCASRSRTTRPVSRRRRAVRRGTEGVIQMAVTVFIPTALRQFAGDRAEISVEARTVGEALDKVTGEHAELRKHLYGDGGALRNFVNVYVNDEDIRATERLETPVKNGDTISIVPAIAGGAATEKDASTQGAAGEVSASVESASAVKSTSASAVERDAASLPSLSNEEIAR